MKPGVTCQKLVSLNKISLVIEKIHLFIEKQDDKPTVTYLFFIFWGRGGAHLTKGKPDPKSHFGGGVHLPHHVTSPTIYSKHSQTQKCNKKYQY